MSGPAGYVSALTATTFVVTVTALTGEAGTSLKVQTRTLGSAADWTTQATDASPAVADVLTASGLTQGTSLEWRLVEDNGTVYDGTHGVVTPAASLWATLLATVSTALQGQSLASTAIYTGRQPEPNYADVAAVLRSTAERVTRAANNVERVEFPVEVEFRVTRTDDDGDLQKAAVETWQERLRSALHEKHAADFPGVAGLEEVRVEVETKDARPGAVDEYEDEVRARAVVRFVVWRNK